MQVVSKSREIGRFSTFWERFTRQFKGLSGFDMLWCLRQWNLFCSCFPIYVCVVCKLAIKRMILLFLFFCLVCKTSVLPIVITWWVDRWTQYSYCSTVYSWIFTHLELPVKQLSLTKCEEDDLTLGKRRRIHDEQIISERMALKVEEKRKRLTAKFNCQSERRSQNILNFEKPVLS